jgi:hypothetical protein
MDGLALKTARLRAGATLDDIARTTKVPVRMLEAIERGAFDRLPVGVYRRAYVRAYAEAVGLDPHEVLRDLKDALSDAGFRLAELLSNREQPAASVARYRAAAMTDAAIVAAIAALHVGGSAAAAGVSFWALAGATPIALAALTLCTAALYIALLGGTGVGTAGARLFGVEFVPKPSAPLRGDALARRTIDYLRAETRVLFSARAQADEQQLDGPLPES